MSLVCLSPILSYGLTTNTKSYMGFSNNPCLDPYDDFERQQTLPHAPVMAEGLIASTHPSNNFVIIMFLIVFF